MNNGGAGRGRALRVLAEGQPLSKPSRLPSGSSFRPVQSKSPLDFICIDFKRKIPLCCLLLNSSPRAQEGQTKMPMCLFLNHLIIKRSPFTCRTQSIKPPKPFYFFQKVSIQVCPPREAQSWGCSHSCFPPGVPRSRAGRESWIWGPTRGAGSGGPQPQLRRLVPCGASLMFNLRQPAASTASDSEGAPHPHPSRAEFLP